MKNPKIENCIICGSNKITKTMYFYKTKEGFIRKFLYKLPLKFLISFCKIIPDTFKRRIKEIIYNRTTFRGNKFYCSACKTGWHHPIIPEKKLNDYYKSFYWMHRSDKEKIYDFNVKDKPDEIRLSYVREQFSFLKNKSIKFQSVLDFGAGDCCGGYFVKNLINKKDVSIFDPSNSARKLAKKYGLKVNKTLKNRKFDLIYSSHSIEHVSDISSTLNRLRDALNKKGYIFFETPNISSKEVFLHLIHTPHTYMFSTESFRNIALKYGFKIIAIKTSGPKWQKEFNYLKDSSKADLRVCMQKV